jgi:hypothetical protein
MAASFRSTNAGATSFLNNQLRLFVTDNIAAFGGPCTSYDAACPGGATAANMAAKVDAAPNPMRRGYIKNLCRTILTNNTLLSSFLANAGLNMNQAPRRANYTAVVRAFQPGMAVPNSVLNALEAVRTSANAKGYSNQDQWRYIVLPVCSSIASEVL